MNIVDVRDPVEDTVDGYSFDGSCEYVALKDGSICLYYREECNTRTRCLIRAKDVKHLIKALELAAKMGEDR